MKLVSCFWRKNKSRLLFLLLLTITATATNLSFPYLLKNIVDGIQKRLIPKEILKYVFILLIIGSLRSFLSTFLPFWRGRTNEKFAWLCRSSVFSSILKKDYRFSGQFPIGDVIERLDHDLNDLSWFACSGIFRPIEGLLTLLIALIILLSINPLLTLLSVIPPFALGIFWSRLGNRVYSAYQLWRKKIAFVCNFLESSLSGIKLLKAFTKERIQEEKFSSLLKERISSAVAFAKTEAKVAAGFQGVGEIAILIILFPGGIFVIKGLLTLGGFIAFMGYISLLFAPLWDLGNFFVVRKRAQAAEKRIRELAEFPVSIKSEDGRKEIEVKGFRFQSVYFSYNGKEVLKNINLEIREGEKIGIAGTVGSGKTTIAKLLLRLLEPTSGELTILTKDEKKIPLAKIDLTELRNLFGYCPQEASLFSETIYNNILFGREELKGNIQAAVEISSLKEEIETFPNGIESLIGERGVRLSGGQKEKVAIARALLHSPKFLILDDATASLDANVEKRILQDLLKRFKTIILISHRLSLLSLCDIVYVLDKGEIVEEGTPEDLLRKKGLYWQLYEKQMIKEELESAPL